MAASDARGDAHRGVPGHLEDDAELLRVVDAAWQRSECAVIAYDGSEGLSDRVIGALSGHATVRLAHLVHMWRHYGRSMNLIAQHGALESVERQLGEALLVARLGYQLGVELSGELGRGADPQGPAAAADERLAWLDVGSGAGFPGLVVAALLDVEVVLIEPRAKRAAFLELALRSVGARGRVFECRLEAYADGVGQPRMGTFAFASARAVFSPGEWVGRAERWVRPGGWILVDAHRDSSQELGWGTEARLEAGPWAVRAFQRPVD